MVWRIINGPPGIGKSRFSLALSNNWGIDLVSSDTLLEQRLKMSISDYMNSQNCSDDEKWINFRKEEYKTLQEIEMQYKKSEIVLDLGGGLLAPENVYHNNISLNHLYEIRGKSLRILNSNGLIVTILPYNDLKSSLIAMGKFTKKNRKESRPKQGDEDPVKEGKEKLKLRWDSYKRVGDFIYYIGENKPKKNSNNDPHILNLQQLFEGKLIK